MALLKSVILLTLFSSFYCELFAQSCPPNINFETGTYSRWEFYTGYCCPISTPFFTGPNIKRHELTNGTAVDPYGGFPIVAPATAPATNNYSLKLGNDSASRQAQRARYFVHVPQSNNTYVLVFKYAIVLQDPNHGVADQPRFEVSAFDSATGDLIPCSDVSYVASSTLPGFLQSPVIVSGGAVWYKAWSSASIFLGQQVAGKTVAIDFSTGACDLGAHFGYAYIDMDCGLFQTYYSLACTPSSQVKLDAPPGYLKYEWMDSALTKVLSTNQTYYVGVPDTSTVFAVVLTPFSGFGCLDTLYAKIANLSVRSTRDTTLCLNGNAGTLQLNATVKGDAVPIIYNWYPATGLSCTNCPNPVATISSSINYHVSVTDSNGCVKSDSTIITVAQEVKADISLPSDTICQYEQIEIADSSFNISKVTHYWEIDTGTIISGSGGPVIKANWLTPGLKKLRLRVSNGDCEIKDSTTIYVKPSPHAFFEIKHNLCLNEVIKIYPKRNDNTFYYWTIDENTIKDTLYQESFDLAWHTLDKKNIQLKTISENGCSAFYDTIVRIHEYPPGKIEINNPYVCMGDTILLSTIPGPYYTYHWSPQSFFTNNNSAQVSALVNQNTYVSLTVKSQWGCDINDSLYVSTERCCKLILPGAFAPNGSGQNTRFRIISQGQYTIHTFIIANRWGKILHNATDNSGWDGTYSGELQSPGVYGYYIKYICESGKVEEIKGTFILVR